MFPTFKKLLPNSPPKSILEIWSSAIMVSFIVPSKAIQLQKYHGSKINFQFYQKLDQNIDLAINMVWFNSKFSEQRVVFLHFSIFLVKWCFFWSRFFLFENSHRSFSSILHQNVIFEENFHFCKIVIFERKISCDKNDKSMTILAFTKLLPKMKSEKFRLNVMWLLKKPKSTKSKNLMLLKPNC